MLFLVFGLGNHRYALDAAQTEPAAYGRAPSAFESAHWITRTALCVEVRDPGRANGPPPERDKAGSTAEPFANPRSKVTGSGRSRRISHRLPGWGASRVAGPCCW